MSAEVVSVGAEVLRRARLLMGVVDSVSGGVRDSERLRFRGRGRIDVAVVTAVCSIQAWIVSREEDVVEREVWVWRELSCDEGLVIIVEAQSDGEAIDHHRIHLIAFTRLMYARGAMADVLCYSSRPLLICRFTKGGESRVATGRHRGSANLRETPGHMTDLYLQSGDSTSNMMSKFTSRALFYSFDRRDEMLSNFT